MQKQHKLMAVGVGIGVAYGLGMRALGLLREGTNSNWIVAPIVVMSIAFVFAVPFAMGYLTIAIQARQRRVSYVEAICLPWVTVLLVMAGCVAALWEGFICVIMITPAAAVLGSVGGTIALWVAERSRRAQTMNFSMAIVALLPLLVAPVEHRLTAAPQIRSVESDIQIHASPETVWRNIERVRMIDERELPRSWNRTIGFPRPLEATLSHEGIGGVRHATFAGNVLFVETVDEWEPQRRLGFGIRADAEHIPPTTLDEHVTVGGPHFDVLHGEYILESAADGVQLRLISRHRVSTDFNWYARLWTDAIMRDVQRSILHVIKKRCEAGG